MTVAATATRYHLIAMGVGTIGEVAILSTAIYLDQGVLLAVLGPLLLLFAVLLWINKVTGIRCRHCNNIFGITLGSGGWPSVPAKCLVCGRPDD